MIFNLENVNKILEFVVSGGTIIGFLYGGWKMIIVPIRNLCASVQKMESTQTSEVLPVINSIKNQFSVNSGKSIMDRISRIDDNTRLAELRSKLIASNLVTTCMLEFDKSGQLVWANKAFLDITGLQLEQIRNNEWFVCVSEEDRERVWNLWKHSLDSKIPFESEFEIKNQINHSHKNVKCVVHPHKSIANTPDGGILGYYGTIVEMI